MKRYLRHIIVIWVLTALVFSLYSCKEEGPKLYNNAVISLTPMSLSVSQTSVHFYTYEVSSQYIDVTTTNVSWRFTNIPDWIKIDPVSGSANSRVKITCTKNEDLTTRMGVVTFQSTSSDWNYSTTLTVSQDRNVYTAIPESESINVPWSESQNIIFVDANSDEWDVFVDNNCSSWCSAQKNGRSVEIKCKENATTSSRLGTVYISTSDNNYSIRVVQSAIEFAVSSDTSLLYFSDMPGTAQIYINTYNGVKWNAFSDDEWISVNPKSGVGNGVIDVSVTESDRDVTREGAVYVSTSGGTMTYMPVSQSGKYMEVNSPSLNFNSKGGETNISIKTNGGWRAVTSDPWILLSDTVGSLDCSLGLRVTENNNIDQREGVVYVIPKYQGNSYMFKVSQKGRYLILTDTMVVFWAGDSVKSVRVDTDCDFGVKSGSNWFIAGSDSSRVILSLKDSIKKSMEDSVIVFLKGLDSGTLEKKLYVYARGVDDSYVDLGLSVKWAVCNVGALNGEDYGDYFAWGEVDPYYELGYAQKDLTDYSYDYNTGQYTYYHWKDGKTRGYDWASYKYCNGDASSITKYFNTSDSEIGNSVVLEAADDVASVRWDGSWRMPTYDEFNELLDKGNCSWTWTTHNGVKGYEVTSKIKGYEGNSIFLPASGSRNVRSLDQINQECYYWTSTLSNYSSSRACVGSSKNISDCARSIGSSVRPVLPFSSSELKSILFENDRINLMVDEQKELKVIGKKKNDDSLSVKINPVISISDTSVVVLKNGVITAIAEGSCTITATLDELTASCTVTVLDPDHMQHESVDLGLSVKWATINVGAVSPERIGDYYAWGETEPYYERGQAYISYPEWRNGKDYGYSWSSYFDTNDGGSTFVKYRSDVKTVLDPDDDVANVKWGEGWRLPSKAEIEELLNSDNCTWTWTQLNGVEGYLVTGKKTGYENNSIFLPTSGSRSEYGINNSRGYYWSNTLYTESSYNAWNFYFRRSGSYYCSYSGRYVGCAVRPVRSFSSKDLKSIEFEQKSISMMAGESEELELICRKPDNRVVGIIMDSLKWTSSDTTVAKVIGGIVTAIMDGSCKITVSYDSLSAECMLTVTDPDKIAKEGVDLGLSVKWATFNVGSISPERAGDYYAWGETEPYYEVGQAQAEIPVWKEGKTKGYAWDSYFDTEDGGSTFVKYNSNGGLKVLAPEDDVAHVKWGGDWRMPTNAELSELRQDSLTEWTWTTLNGVCGYRITGKRKGYEDRSIFLPVTGYRYNEYIIYPSEGYYWSGSMGTSYWYSNSLALRLYFTSGSNSSQTSSRYYGYAVRPVIPYNRNDLKTIQLDITNLNLILGEEKKLNLTCRKFDDDIVFINLDSVKWTSSDTTVAKVLEGVITATGEGSCTITATLDANLTSVCSVVVTDVDKVEKEWVDLGLSVKWATFNVGAMHPEDYGDYYAWGETETYYKTGQAQMSNPSWREEKTNGYTWSSYFDTTDDGRTFTKYTESGVELNPEDDVAHVRWGGSWRMPTDSEFDELLNSDNCTWTWITQNGINGYKVTSKKTGYEDKSIFLPAAGFRSDTGQGDMYDRGHYWCKTMYSDSYYANYIYFYSNSLYLYYKSRSIGCSVRPVCWFDSKDLYTIEFDINSLNMVPGEYGDINLICRKPDNSVVPFNPDSIEWKSSDNSVATISNGVIRAKAEGNCTVSAVIGTLIAECDVTVVDPDLVAKEWVDLGLSVKWATFNVGAYSPEMYGDYYAWGETETYYLTGQGQMGSPSWREGKTSGYAWQSYFDTETGGSTFTKYNLNGETELDPEDDVAYVKWGANWHMPTIEEFNELRSNCTWIWTTQNGINGYKVTSNKTGYEDKSIFLPAAGYRSDTDQIRIGSYGYYWCRSVYSSNSSYADVIYLYNSWYGRETNYMFRSIGCPVRPVCSYSIKDLKMIEIDRNSLDLVPGERYDLGIICRKPDNSTVVMSLDLLKWTTSDNAIATVTDGHVVAVSDGTCTITATLDTMTAICTVKVTDPDLVAKEYVDLGLSVKWATFNVGAYSPEMYGDYYAWGETDTYYNQGEGQYQDPSWKDGKSSGYAWDSYFDTNDNGISFTKYRSDGGKTTLDIEDDIANVRWGGSWRMPTSQEFNELVNNGTWSWTTRNGISGYQVTSNRPGYEGRSVFLPAAGYRTNKSITSVGYGYYWSSSLGSFDSIRSTYVYLSDGRRYTSNGNRSVGRSIRPVCSFTSDEMKEIELNFFQFKMIPNDQLDLIASGIKNDNNTVQVPKDSVLWTSNNEAVATVSNGKVVAVGAGNCTVTAKYGTHSATCTVTVVDPNSVTPEYVDLGLSVKWATFNVGAYSPEMFGDYYAWGETDTYYESGQSMLKAPETKSGKKYGYAWKSYTYCNGTESSISKYCDNSSYGTVDSKTMLEADDDVAHVNWGGDWRMPTADEFSELGNSNNCTWTWTARNGIKGYVITSKKTGYTDRSIFLPAAGYRSGLDFNGLGSSGYYWTNSLYGNANYGREFSFYSDIRSNSYHSRSYGEVVRPVIPFVDSDIDHVTLSRTEISLLPGEPASLGATVYKNDGYSVVSPVVKWTSGNEAVVTVSGSSTTGSVTAVGPGVCTVTASFGTHEAECTVTVVDLSQVQPEYVDLGLSVKWATFNVGAYSPEVYGDYFAWGETEPYYESGQATLNNPKWKSGKTAGYTWSNYTYCRGSNMSLTKYCSDGGYGNNGYSDTKTELDLADDAANVKWGGNWRIPSTEEFGELISNCTWTWTSVNGVTGHRVTSKIAGYEDRSIFLPAAGYRNDVSYKRGSDGYYWSRSLNTNVPYKSRYLYFYSSNKNNTYTEDRYYGYTIRPVCPYTDDEIDHFELTKSEMALDVDDYFKLELTAVYDDGHRWILSDVEWSSDDEDVATVEDGVVTGIGNGVCNITVTYGNRSFTCEVTVPAQNND